MATPGSPRRARARRALLCLILLAPWASPGAVESDPLPVPKGGARERAVRSYNEGVALMLDKRYAEAQARFEQALESDASLAEAHNNLAFSLRMQGRHNFERSLEHYNRALALNPNLAQAYMYRGVLYTQMGDFARARADLARLSTLDRDLAARLENVIAGAGTRDDRGGIAGQYD